MLRMRLYLTRSHLNSSVSRMHTRYFEFAWVSSQSSSSQPLSGRFSA